MLTLTTHPHRKLDLPSFPLSSTFLGGLQLPYEEGNAVTSEKLTFLRENEEALAIRNEYGADLVVLIGELNDVCGQA